MNYYSHREFVDVRFKYGVYWITYTVELEADMRKVDVGAGELEFWGRPVTHSIVTWEVDEIYIKSISWNQGCGANGTRYELSGDEFAKWSPKTYQRILDAVLEQHELGNIEFEAMDEW